MMEIIKNPTTADEAMVWFWQRYVTGESRITYRVVFRDEVGRFAKKETKPEMPVVRRRPVRLVPVSNYGQVTDYIKL